MLEKLGLCRKWIFWIRNCLSSTSTSVLVNRSPIEKFKPSKGLKQGDPLALFLFLIVNDGLTGIIRQDIRLNQL